MVNGYGGASPVTVRSERDDSLKTYDDHRFLPPLRSDIQILFHGVSLIIG